MEKINENLELIKNRITKQNVIIGNSTFIIKDLIEMLYKLEEEVLKIKEDIVILKEVKI